MTEHDQSPSTSPTPGPAARVLSRASSVKTSAREHLRSPTLFRNASKRLSFSPLLRRHSLSLPGFSINLPGNSNMKRKPPAYATDNPAFQPLSVRTSTLYPLDFDPAKAMEEVKKDQLAPQKVDTKGKKAIRNFSRLTPIIDKNGSNDTIVPIRKEQSPPDAPPLSPSVEELQAEWAAIRAANRAAAARTRSTILSPDFRAVAYKNTLAGTPPGTPTVTPAKTQFGESRVSGKDNSDYEDKARSASILGSMSQMPFNNGITQIRHPANNIDTPQKSSGEDPSPKYSHMSMVSPASVKSHYDHVSFYGGDYTPSKEKKDDDKSQTMGSLEFLMSQPAPDMSQHPMFSSKPFESRSAAPAMETNMTADQACAYFSKLYKKKRDDLKIRVGSAQKGDSLPRVKQPAYTEEQEWDDALRDAAIKTKKKLEAKLNVQQEFLTNEASPLPKSAGKTPKTPLRIDTNAANSSPIADLFIAFRIATPLGDDFNKKPASAGLRSISNLFKSKSSTSSTFSDSTLSARSPETSAQIREKKEKDIRITTNCPTFDYSLSSPYPRHPHTSRAWHSRNLRCAGCTFTTCANCGRACCARAACFWALENHKENYEGLSRAKEIKEAIEELKPSGNEVGTFLQCTGCMKMVCPDCCGMCPIENCKDLMCKECKEGDVWGPCDWHEGL